MSDEVIRRMQNLRVSLPPGYTSPALELFQPRHAAEARRLQSNSQAGQQPDVLPSVTAGNPEPHLRSMAYANNNRFARDLTATNAPLAMNMGQNQSTEPGMGDYGFSYLEPAEQPITSSNARMSYQPHSPSQGLRTASNSAATSSRVSTPLFGFTPSPPGLRATFTPPGNLEPDAFVLDDSRSFWDNPQQELSPPQNLGTDLAFDDNIHPSSRLSSVSRDRSPVEFQFQRTRRQNLGGYIDLTTEPSSPPMAAAAPKRGLSRTQDSRASSTASLHQSKRHKTQHTASLSTGSLTIKDEPDKIDEVDLRDVDDDTGLSKVLEQQRAETVKAQQKETGKPITFSNIVCVVCLEPPTNITATHCGESTDHIFTPPSLTQFLQVTSTAIPV